MTLINMSANNAINNAIKAPQMLNLNVATIRNQKTLIWLQHQTPTVDWSVWHAIVTSMSDYHFWCRRNVKLVGIILITIPEDNEINEFLEELYMISKSVSMIMLSNNILQHKSVEYWSENFDNIVSLDEMINQYPFIDMQWNGTMADAVILFALLSRYNRIVDCPMIKERTTYDITYEYNITPQSVWLFTQFFCHPSKKRTNEIKECLQRNCICPYIDTIVLLNERDYSKEWKGFRGANKIKQIIIGERLTYRHFIEYVYNHVPASVFAILCNADIYMGVSLCDLWKINMKDCMIALLRWDDMGDGPDNAVIFGPRSDSQDTWIVLSDSIHARTFAYDTLNFKLGQPGCDNAFAGYMLRNKFLLLNPALSFKTYHIHNSSIRNYDPKIAISASLYICMAPTYVIDTKQEKVPSTLPKYHISNKCVSFEIKSSSLSNEITYCTMVEKDGRYKWESSVENFYFEAAIPIYYWKKACVTPTGLVYDLYSIYIGNHDNSHEYWKNANIDIYTPLKKQSQMIAIPFMDISVFLHPDVYILEYVSRCSRLLHLCPDATYWYPTSWQKQCEIIGWKMNDHAMEFDPTIACWADEVIGFLPGHLELGNEDIMELRGQLDTWQALPNAGKCCIIEDEILSTDFIENTLKSSILKGMDVHIVNDVRGYNTKVYDAIVGSSLCIFIGGKNTKEKWAKLWALPCNCRVIEFQQELQLDGEFQHISHVAEYLSWVLLLSKGTMGDVREQVVTSLDKWNKKHTL